MSTRAVAETLGWPVRRTLRWLRRWARRGWVRAVPAPRDGTPGRPGWRWEVVA